MGRPRRPNVIRRRGRRRAHNWQSLGARSKVASFCDDDERTDQAVFFRRLRRVAGFVSICRHTWPQSRQEKIGTVARRLAKGSRSIVVDPHFGQRDDGSVGGIDPHKS